jgi:hypothetical protein
VAGDWIKMRADLFTHPKVVRISSALKADTLRTVGGLMSVWCLFDAHSEDGQLEGYSPEVLNAHLRWDGFSEAMIAVDWLRFDPAHGLSLPEFDTHNGASAKRRAQEADRKRAERAASKDDPQDGGKPSALNADKKRTREEKRREEIDTPRKARKTKLPEDFAINETGLRVAHEAGVNVDRELSQFRDHHAAKGSAMVDWQAAWRTWVGNAVQFGRAGKPANDDPYGLKRAL